MNTFSQFIGFLFFTAIEISGFWYFTFLIYMVPFWMIMGAAEIYGKMNKEIDPELIRRKILSEKKGVKIICNNT